MYICQGCEYYVIGRGEDWCNELQNLDEKITEGKCDRRKSLPGYDQFTEHPKDNNETPKRKICPRCKSNYLREPITHNALSRVDNKTYICSPCGQTEAIIACLKSEYMKQKGGTT